MRLALSTLALALSTLTLTPVAHAAPSPDVYVSRVTPLPGAAIRVTMSDGHRARLTPCRYEDGRRCYWHAPSRGNGRGRSFVVVRGDLFRVSLLASDTR